MRNAIAKKIRRVARKGATTVRPEFRWWARPRVFKAWSLVGTWAVQALAAIGWRSPAERWLGVIRAVPKRGIRLVVVR